MGEREAPEPEVDPVRPGGERHIDPVVQEERDPRCAGGGEEEAGELLEPPASAPGAPEVEGDPPGARREDGGRGFREVRAREDPVIGHDVDPGDHPRRSPTAGPPPRSHAPASIRLFPAGCAPVKRTAPSPAWTTSPSPGSR